MAKQKIIISNFSGGLSESEKLGIPNAFKFAKALDIHEDPSYVTLHPKTAKVSGSTVADLVKWVEDGTPHSTDRYFYGDAGKIYKETSGGSWSLLQTTSSASGNGLLVFDDYLYYSLDAELGRYGKLSGTPAFDDAFLSDGTNDLEASGGGTGAADYVPPTSISEAATARQTWTCVNDPLKAVIIDVDVVGTGDWTVTVHNAANVSIGSKTIANASVSTGDLTFTFATPLRMVIGNSYHFHVTSTVANGGVDTNAATDLEGAEFSTLRGILINDGDWHPMTSFVDTLIIGNERYLATWDQATYYPNKITFEPGFKVRGLTKLDEYIVASCWKGTNIDSYEEGRIYIWDGIASSYNLSIPVNEGLPNAMISSKNRLVSVLGNKGGIYLGTNPFQKYKDKIVKLAKGKKMEVYPGAITNWQGKTLIGFGGSTDDSSGVEQGVYGFGNKYDALPEVLTYDFVISTGTTQGTTLQIGMVKGFGKDLYIGWRDDTTYGVDKVIKTDNAATAGSFESLIFDGGNPNKEMQAIKLLITFEALESGESVTPKFKSDRTSSFTTGTAQSTVGATKAEYFFDKERPKEIEFGFNLATSTTYPKITSLQFFYDDLVEEIDE